MDGGAVAVQQAVGLQFEFLACVQDKHEIVPIPFLVKWITICEFKIVKYSPQ